MKVIRNLMDKIGGLVRNEYSREELEAEMDRILELQLKECREMDETDAEIIPGQPSRSTSRSNSHSRSPNLTPPRRRVESKPSRNWFGRRK